MKIFLAKTLVYENVNEYTLTLQVRNSPDLVAEAQLVIKVKDVNNLGCTFPNSIITTFDPKTKIKPEVKVVALLLPSFCLLFTII